MRSILSLAVSHWSLSLAAQAAPEKMQAAEVGEGGTLSVQARPVPRPGAGEVLIKVRAAGVNPVDWKVALRRLGMVPGTDVSGIIDTLGEGVTGWKVGDQVLGFARQSGSYAEYAVIPVNEPGAQAEVHDLRAGRRRAHRGARPRIARCTRPAKSQRGQTVLIHGAAGGVGSAAVQIAKAAGRARHRHRLA